MWTAEGGPSSIPISNHFFTRNLILSLKMNAVVFSETMANTSTDYTSSHPGYHFTELKSHKNAPFLGPAHSLQ